MAVAAISRSRTFAALTSRLRFELRRVPTRIPIKVTSNLGDQVWVPSAGQFTIALALADMNLDGNLDMVGLTNANYMVVLPGLGDGTFQPVMDGSVFYGTPLSPLGLAIADFNLDGKPDGRFLQQRTSRCLRIRRTPRPEPNFWSSNSLPS